MILLALQQLRRRGTRYASLLFAIFASVALTTASVALTSSLITNVNSVFAQPYENAEWVVTVSGADQPEVDQLRSSLSATPQANAVAWDQRASVSIREADGIYEDAVLYSIEQGPLQWREVEQGRLPEQPAEIAVTASEEAPPVGTELQVRTSGAEDDVTATVVGHVEAAAQDLLIGGTSVFASPATVAGWDAGTVHGELRLSSPVEPAVDPSFATPVAAAAHVEELSDTYLGKRDRYFLVVTAFVLVAAVVAFLVIFSAYNVLTAERRREFGLIRAVGASTSQIIGSVAVESVILGALASGLGAPAGLAAARFLAGRAEGFGVRVPMESITMPDNVGWWIIAAGIAMPVLASLPAAISACRSTTVEALSPTAISRSRPGMSLLWFVVAMLLLAGGWWLSGQVPRLGGQRGLLVSIAAAGVAVLGVALAAGLLLPVGSPRV